MRLGRMAPDGADTLLLRAGLLGPADSVPAWREWRSTHDVQSIYGPSSALLSLISASVPDDELGPDRDVLRGLRRRAWAVNATQRESLARTLAHLSDSGVDACPVRGSHSLVAPPPHEPALPVTRNDLWVGPGDWVTALEVLVTLNFVAESFAGSDDSNLLLTDPQGNRLVLTWGYVFPRWSRTPYEHGPEPRAQWRGLSIPTLSAPQALVAAIVEGVGPHGAQALTWPIEVSRLVNAHSDDPDFWDLVGEAAIDSGQAPVVAAALEWVRGTLDIPSPPSLVSVLAECAMNPRLRLERALMSHGLPSASRPRRALDVRRARRRAPWSAVPHAAPQ